MSNAICFVILLNTWTRDILFKVSRDVEIRPGRFLYGHSAKNDELASKAAAQEVLAALQLFSLFESLVIIIPLQTIIDCQGNVGIA
jgi:hypothetical protein